MPFYPAAVIWQSCVSHLNPALPECCNCLQAPTSNVIKLFEKNSFHILSCPYLASTYPILSITFITQHPPPPECNKDTCQICVASRKDTGPGYGTLAHKFFCRVLPSLHHTQSSTYYLKLKYVSVDLRLDWIMSQTRRWKSRLYP